MRVTVDVPSSRPPCPSVGRPAESESIEMSLNQDNKSKEEEARLLDTKDNLCAHCQDMRRAEETGVRNINLQKRVLIPRTGTELWPN